MMRNSNLAEFAGGHGHPNRWHSFRALSAADCNELSRFYRELDFDERRRRFGGVLSDRALDRYCAAINWRRSLMIACISRSRFDAVLEVHQVSTGWERCEVALACRSMRNRGTAIAQLLQLAAFAAGKLGCREFVVAPDESARIMFPMLQGMGRARQDGDHAVIDLGEYVALRTSADRAALQPA